MVSEDVAGNGDRGSHLFSARYTGGLPMLILAVINGGGSGLVHVHISALSAPLRIIIRRLDGSPV